MVHHRHPVHDIRQSHHLARLRHRDAEWLLAQHMLAGGKGVPRDRQMQRLRRGDHEGVHVVSEKVVVVRRGAGHIIFPRNMLRPL